MQLTGIHHVSAITAQAKENLQFYTEVLGMRLVKKTVNQDSPSMYHLFYADAKGTAGTDFTFFEIPMAGRTYPGTNAITRTSLRVASDAAIFFWEERLLAHDVAIQWKGEENGRQVLYFTDQEGQRVALISDETNKGVEGGIPFFHPDIPEEMAIRGLGPVEITVREKGLALYLLKTSLNFAVSHTFVHPVTQSLVQVLTTGEGGTGAEVYLIEEKEAPNERPGRGSVHHVAFRVPDVDQLHAWAERLSDNGFTHSGVVNRYYFQSLYVKDGNGIVVELATDGPGFTVDEPLDHLGEHLALPDFLEPDREAIEASLKPLQLE